MLSDSHDDNAISSKRVVTFLAFLLCVAAFIGDLFFGLTITQAIYDSMVYIVIGGLGFTGLEKFAPVAYTKQDAPPPMPPYNPYGYYGGGYNNHYHDSGDCEGERDYSPSAGEVSEEPVKRKTRK